jgi:hypothetical protein
MADLEGALGRGRHAAPTPPSGMRLSGPSGMRGVDCTGGCSPAAMHAGGWSFICRYLSWSPNPKNLIMPSPPYDAELRRYLDAGIMVVANWESSGKPGKGFETGAADAHEAQRQLDLMGAGTPPVYFSIDYDAPPSHQGLIDSYFDGAASVMGLARIGGYGSYWVIKRLFDNNKISWAWQCQAWSGGHTDPRIHILQVNSAGYVYVGGTQCDVDEAWLPDFGAMPRGGPPGPPPPPPEEVDVGTPTDNANTLLDTLLPDPFDPTGQHRMNVRDTVAWGTAHAAHAREEAAAARKAADVAVGQLAGLQTAVSQLATAVATNQGIDPAALKTAITEAITEALASSVHVVGSLAVAPNDPPPPPP